MHQMLHIFSSQTLNRNRSSRATTAPVAAMEAAITKPVQLLNCGLVIVWWARRKRGALLKHLGNDSTLRRVFWWVQAPSFLAVSSALSLSEQSYISTTLDAAATATNNCCCCLWHFLQFFVLLLRCRLWEDCIIVCCCWWWWVSEWDFFCISGLRNDRRKCNLRYKFKSFPGWCRRCRLSFYVCPSLILLQNEKCYIQEYILGFANYELLFISRSVGGKF